MRRTNSQAPLPAPIPLPPVRRPAPPPPTTTTPRPPPPFLAPRRPPFPFTTTSRPLPPRPAGSTNPLERCRQIQADPSLAAEVMLRENLVFAAEGKIEKRMILLTNVRLKKLVEFVFVLPKCL